VGDFFGLIVVQRFLLVVFIFSVVCFLGPLHICLARRVGVMDKIVVLVTMCSLENHHHHLTCIV